MYNSHTVIKSVAMVPKEAPVVADLLTIIFLSNIPKGLDDDDILELLSTCGPVKIWKRVDNIDGTPTHFGFCTFENALGVIKACRSLKGTAEKQYPFKVSIDIATKNHIRTHPQNKQDIVDPEVIEKLKELFEPLKDFEADQFLRSMDQGQENIKPAENQKVDIEDEKKREERKEQERLLAFQDRERRFEQKESIRIKRFNEDMISEEEFENKRQKSKTYWLKKLSEYDDDVEKERGNEEFYRDSVRWWNRRQRDIQREKDLDERDRIAEKEEIDFAIAQEKESALRAEEEQKEQEEKAKAAKQSNELKATEDNGFVVGRIMTKEERMKAIQDLIAAIPVDKEGLWDWSVKWEFMNERILEKKIQPFIKKKVVEYVGEVSNDLVSFIVDKIREFGEVQVIFDALQPVLAEETEVFVIKVWRMVIYETEARSKGL
ncbi:hypothetical protein BC833DRAFT_604708 [Globomyces pollinis-pini]|nr:hypothetical protein BC833DRAFT_604708 [Globomyces pollinis-pini]